MRAVVQRVLRSSVAVDGDVVARIDRGLNVLLGVGKDDDAERAGALASKAAHLRIFPDAAGRMQRSLLDERWGMLVVPQFTLYGDCSRGRRPDFTAAAAPGPARELCDAFVRCVAGMGIRVETGVFGAHMTVEITNWGPVTIILEE
jgi:D-tyrosyl-tRNA(Tyr) deacylase